MKSLAVSGIAGFFYSMLAPHGPLLALLLGVNILDYATGIVLAASHGNLSSSKGIVGILKKSGYWALVLTALAIEMLIPYAAPQFGITVNIFPTLTDTVIIWLAVNETISIVENLGDLGVPIPQKLKDIIAKFKDGFK